MAKKNKTIFIIRDEKASNDSYEEIISTWMDENHPDKTVIGCEENGEFLVNEEDNSMMVMEYVVYDN